MASLKLETYEKREIFRH